MRVGTIRNIQRILTLISFAAIIGIVLIVARVFGYGLTWSANGAAQGLVLAAFDKEIALVSGHAGFDSGAVCTDKDDSVTLTEADVNATVTELVAQRLRRAGADVRILEEYDPALEDLSADVLLSLHADSCISASGYKAAYHTNSRIPMTNDRILACLDKHYPAATGLSPHPNTVTHNMTKYHAFQRIAPDTPAAILEMGFLGGDGTLLTEEADTVARGITDSLLCFLQDETGQ